MIARMMMRTVIAIARMVMRTCNKASLQFLALVSSRREPTVAVSTFNIENEVEFSEGNPEKVFLVSGWRLGTCD